MTALDRSIPPKPAQLLRDRIAMILMLLLAAGSVAVCVEAALTFGSVPPAAVAVEAWRMFGYAVFAGLFTLVGLFPRRMKGVWELILFHKAATATFLIQYIGVDADAGASATETILNIVLNDFLLVVVTLIAYGLAQGWRAWTSDR